MEGHVTCEACGKVEFAITEHRVVELLPGIARSEFVHRCPGCGYNRGDMAYESELAEARYEAVDELVDLFRSPEEAGRWLALPAAALGGEAPGSLLNTTEGVERVRMVIDSLYRATQEARQRRDAVAKAKFDEWVLRWSIGPGMNDKARMEAHDPRIRPDLVSSTGEPLYTGCDGWVGAGWIPLLDRLAADLVALGWDRDLHQVKEKFGELRFYVGKANETMRARIRSARAESLRTCEHCGDPGSARPTRTSWIKTECDACRAAWTPTAVGGRGGPSGLDPAQ